MRRSTLSLGALVCGLGALLLPATSAAAPKQTTPAPKPAAKTTTKTPKPNLSKAKLNNTNSGAAAASVARAKRQAKSRHGTLYVVQVRNPHWGRSGYMGHDHAVVRARVLRHRGFSAHTHHAGSRGWWVHYNWLHWQSRGAVTDRNLAHSMATRYRAAGLHARVITRSFNR